MKKTPGVTIEVDKGKIVKITKDEGVSLRLLHIQGPVGQLSTEEFDTDEKLVVEYLTDGDTACTARTNYIWNEELQKFMLDGTHDDLYENKYGEEIMLDNSGRPYVMPPD